MMNVNPPSQFSLVWKKQDIPTTDARSTFAFDPAETEFVATDGAMQKFGTHTLIRCLNRLTYLAKAADGLDYLQVFETDDHGQLWLMQDEEKITALLPNEH